MLKYYNYDIVCQEIPDELTLAINISGCPNRCKGCHSPWLWEETGQELTPENTNRIINCYRSAITCVCFMGGDQAPQEIEKLAKYVNNNYPEIKIAWYSGKQKFPPSVNINLFQYIKLGAYIEKLGGLRSKITNQRLYRIIADGHSEVVEMNA